MAPMCPGKAGGLIVFWFVCAILSLATLAFVLTPILRPPKGAGEHPDVALYKSQIAEVERDIARGVIAAEEGSQMKTEVARRLLSASRTFAQQGKAGPKAVPVVLAFALCVPLISGVLYWQIGAPGALDLPLQMRLAAAEETRANRHGQAVAEANAREIAPSDVPADYLASVEQLRRLVPQRKDDLQGWELLAYHEPRLRNFSAAAKAQSRVILLKGDAATVDDLLRYVELLVAAADGYVSPETEEVVRQVLEIAPNRVPALYYMGAMFDQTDRPDLAFRFWRSILEGNAPESLYTTLARDQVPRAAFLAGRKYTVPATVSAPVALPGPTQDQMLAAQDMAEEDRGAMIEGMVSGLAERLETEGGTAAEWAQLIRDYGVLGRKSDAGKVFAQAREKFASSENAFELLDAAYSER
jgi:cytochrome c-type biogenesis protein CcmH